MVATDSRVPGALLASGRACDVFEYGNDAVLRRYREGGDPAGEARMMRRAEAAGVRVPRIHEVQPDALVLERIEGRTMLEEIERKPWKALKFARRLGVLHRQLLGSGLVHMDFHPLNVMLAPDGPVVIDWSNAREGKPEEDVAFTQVILATSDSDFDGWLERIGRIVRRRFVASYLRGVGMVPSHDLLVAAAHQRSLDPHLRERELAAVKAFLSRPS